MRQELKNEQTKVLDKARYNAATDTLLDAVGRGGGFADSLDRFFNTLKNGESNPLLDLLADADPTNREALLEFISLYGRFGIPEKLEQESPNTLRG